MFIQCSEAKAKCKTKIDELVRVTINPEKRHHLPFPSNYEFTECILPKKFISLADRIHNFGIRSDDTWIVSFPKSGTTWTVNIVWYLKNNLNFTVNNIDPAYLERSMMLNLNNDIQQDDDYRAFATKLECLDGFNNRDSPRLLKSHLPAHLLPKDIWMIKPKMIYIERNAKDSAISLFHMYKNIANISYRGPLEDFLDDYLSGNVHYGPYHDHAYSYQQLNGSEHILFLKYEEMLAKPFSNIKKISEFLNCSYTDEQLQQLMKYVSFDNMRNRHVVNRIKFPDGFK